MCPKSYYAVCLDKKDQNVKDAEKVASKGVSRRNNKFEYLQYKEVLYQNKTFEAVNYTIRKQNGKIRSLKCTKRGLSSVHIKNKVQNDRVSTLPHDFECQL